MSRKAFFPLGGYFVENSWICCEPCRRTVGTPGGGPTIAGKCLWRGEVEGRGGDASGLAGGTPALLRLRALRPRLVSLSLSATYSMLSLLAAASRRADNTSALYIIRMSRNAFFPLGGYFFENSFNLWSIFAEGVIFSSRAKPGWVHPSGGWFRDCAPSGQAVGEKGEAGRRCEGER
jgi:hypothetical protein